MSADFLKNWKDKQSNRSTHHHDGISYKIHAGIAGSIHIKATIRPEAASVAMALAKALYQAAHDALRSIESQNKQKDKEQVETQSRKIELIKQQRVALSVHRRTGSRRLAAKCIQDAGHTDIMILVSTANKRQKEAHINARNAHMHFLNFKHGISIRTLAERHKLHPSTVHAIIRREAKNRQPVLF